MVGFNFELDVLQSELGSMEADLRTLRKDALKDGNIDDEEQADIDDLNDAIAKVRQQIADLIPNDGPPSMLADPDQSAFANMAAAQSSDAQQAVADSMVREARDAAEAEARAKAETLKKVASLVGEAQSRQFGIEDLGSMPPEALKALYKDLKAARDAGDAGWPQSFMLSGNIGAVKGVLSAVDGPVIDKEDMKADANRLLRIVQETWVDDGDESEMMDIIEYYAETPETMDAFFKELDNHHYWGGIFDEKYTPLITALKKELEGGNGRRFAQLMKQAKSERIQNYEDPEEVTFSGVLWDDVKSGAAARRIAAFGEGFGEAAVRTAKGIASAVEMLADDPVAFAKAMASGVANLPGNVVEFFQSMPERWRKFEQMTPEQQAKAIGEITFEAEMFISDVAGATAAAKSASNVVKNLPKMGPPPTPALAVAGGGRIAAGAGDTAIDLSRFAPDAGVIAGGAILAPEIVHISKALDEANATTAARTADAAADGAGAAARSAEDLFGEFADRRDVGAVRDDMQHLGLSLNDIGVSADDLMSRIGKGTPGEMDDAAKFLREKLVAKADEMPIDADALSSFQDLAGRNPGGVLASRADDVAEAGLTIKGGKNAKSGGDIKTMAQEARGEFDKVRDGYAKALGVDKGGQVHHAVELRVLDDYPGAFTAGELNKFDNMRGIPPELGELKQLHNSKIREFWNRHYKELDKQIDDLGLVRGSTQYRSHVRNYLLEARNEIDHLLGQFFSEYRKGLPKSFE